MAPGVPEEVIDSFDNDARGAFGLSIIIVNWNSKDYLLRALASIEAEVGGIEREIIVIDSGSFDGCGEALSSCAKAKSDSPRRTSATSRPLPGMD